MKLKFALLLVLVLVTVLFPAATIQHSTESNKDIPQKRSEPLITLCRLITPHDPGSGGGGKGET